METSTTPNNKNKQDLHQLVTDTIIEQLEKGVIPWKQPWKGENSLLQGLPFNTATGRKYRGINIVLLWAANLKYEHQTNEWGTFNHWKAKNEFVRSGEKGSVVVKYDVLEVEEAGKKKEIPYLKKYWVFNKCQLESWKPVEDNVVVPLPVADAVVRSTVIDEFLKNTGSVIEEHEGGACYRWKEDKILMPPATSFVDTATCTAVEGYYSTTLHELMHWSGAPHRLNRTKGKRFGDQEYAFEELVAELGAAFLCAEFDISTLQKGDHAGYIDNWIKVLNDNRQMLVSAAADASKAYDYLFSLQPTLD